MLEIILTDTEILATEKNAECKFIFYAQLKKSIVWSQLKWAIR